MASLNLILVAVVSVIIGTGSGIAVGYIQLNPQVNDLVGQIEERDSALDNLMRELEQEIEVNDANMASLNAENIDLQAELGKLRELAGNAESLREQMDALRVPDVRLIDDVASERVEEDGREAYTLNFLLVNFGLEEARNIEVEIMWIQPTACGCEFEIGHSEVITFDTLSGRTSEKFSGLYFFTLSELDSVRVEINWA